MKHIVLLLLAVFVSDLGSAQEFPQRIKLVGDADSRWCVYAVELNEEGEYALIEEDEGGVLMGRVVWYTIHTPGEYLFVEFKSHDPDGTQRFIAVDTHAPRKRPVRIKVKSGLTAYLDGTIERH